MYLFLSLVTKPFSFKLGSEGQLFAKLSLTTQNSTAKNANRYACSLPLCHQLSAENLNPAMLLLRLKFCPKWQPCFLAISNRPPSLVVRKIREMHKAEQRALWREKLTNQRLQFSGFFVIHCKQTINFVCFESHFGQEN